MSYTVDIIHVPVPADDLEAWHILDTDLRVRRKIPGTPLPEEVQELHRRLTGRFPCIMENPDGPWSDGPLLNNFGHRLTLLGISFSRVSEVLPFLVATAHDLGFVVFDGQEERFHRPGQAPGRPLSALAAAAHSTKPTAKPWWRFW
jgi:hypothetical protein